MSLEEKLNLFRVGEGAVVVDGVSHTYWLIDPAFEPRLPYFVGYAAGVLFMSNDVPGPYREAFAVHEVCCIPNKGKPGHCCAALKRELAVVPHGWKLMYRTFRLAFLNGLLAYYGDDRPAFYGELVAMRDLLATANVFEI